MSTIWQRLQRFTPRLQLGAPPGARTGSRTRRFISARKSRVSSSSITLSARMSDCSFLRAPELTPRPASSMLRDRKGLEEITRRARSAWGYEERRRAKSSTVYGGEFGQKLLDEPSRTRVRPSSPTRRNKPHPPEVFLVTRLRSLPGYFNCATDRGHEMPSVGKNTQMSNRKQSQHVKIPQHIFTDSNIHLATQAWMKIASERDCKAIECMINSAAEKEQKNKTEMGRKSYIHQALTQAVRPEAVASAHRWLKKADAEETAAVERLLKTLSSGPPKRPPPIKTTATYQPGKIKHAMSYQIHPEWQWRN
ncbi:hypothetical protein NDU88_004237 [Pleurodeles waltl]|uniref:Uncharacterized protein n=1 Tax=Pleurodeles waltl TaxID=8319 RepID=A0AAV7WUS0_PLEWA|nr:hypothetical protein NDU88_004237 [Pleurodeles waltl]